MKMTMFMVHFIARNKINKLNKAYLHRREGTV